MQESYLSNGIIRSRNDEIHNDPLMLYVFFSSHGVLVSDSHRTNLVAPNGPKDLVYTSRDFKPASPTGREAASRSPRKDRAVETGFTKIGIWAE